MIIEQIQWFLNSFNTQPPEGGWYKLDKRYLRPCRFNTQPPEGGWVIKQAMEDYI